MRVLAIDPGYDRLGVGVLEHTSTGKEQLLYSTCVETDRNSSLPDRLHTVGTTFEKLLRQYAPDAVAIETLFFNQNRTSAIAVAEARGVILYLATKAGCTIHEYGPQEIKVAVTGYGKSDKKQVMEMVKRLIPAVPETSLDDEYDAIAVGITCLAHNRR